MNDSINRRRFARELVTGVAAGAAATCTADAHATEEPKPPAGADQLLAVLKARFPDRLSEEHWKEVRSKIEGQLKASQTLSEFKLENSDEPATVFAAFRGKS